MGWLFRTARSRDGQAHALEEDATSALPVGGQAPGGRSDVLDATLAAKLLEGWLSNRAQTMVPHTLNFRTLGPDEAALLIDVMAAAAQADGEVDPREAKQLPSALERVGAGAAQAEQLNAALAVPQHLGRVTARVQEARLETHAYAAALLAINRRGRVNRSFLTYLAQRLGLSNEVAGSLKRRYRA